MSKRKRKPLSEPARAIVETLEQNAPHDVDIQMLEESSLVDAETTEVAAIAGDGDELPTVEMPAIAEALGVTDLETTVDLRGPDDLHLPVRDDGGPALDPVDVGESVDLESEGEVNGGAEGETDVERDGEAESDAGEPGDEAEPGDPVTAATDRERANLKGLIEALVFATDKPIKVGELARHTDAAPKLVRALLAEIGEEYKPRGIQLAEVAGGYLFRTHVRYGSFVRELTQQKPVRLTRAQLEALAILAYRQPITRPEIDEIRGVDSGPVLKMLLERELVKILGKRDEVGRPIIYGTTPEFLEFFGLSSLKELPNLREFTELTDESHAIAEKELGESWRGPEAAQSDAEAERVARDSVVEHVGPGDLEEQPAQGESEGSSEDDALEPPTSSEPEPEDLLEPETPVEPEPDPDLEPPADLDPRPDPEPDPDDPLDT